MADPLWFQLRDAVYDKQWLVAERLLTAHPMLVDARDGTGETVLHFLAVENDIEGVKWLHQRGFTLNTKNAFGTPGSI